MMMMMEVRTPLGNISITKKISFSPDDDDDGDFFLSPIFKSSQSFVLLRISNF